MFWTNLEEEWVKAINVSGLKFNQRNMFQLNFEQNPQCIPGSFSGGDEMATYSRTAM